MSSFGATVEIQHPAGRELELARYRSLLDAVCGVGFEYPETAHPSAMATLAVAIPAIERDHEAEAFRYLNTRQRMKVKTTLSESNKSQ
jgi:hypothetical protein